MIKDINKLSQGGRSEGHVTPPLPKFNFVNGLHCGKDLQNLQAGCVPNGQPDQTKAI